MSIRRRQAETDPAACLPGLAAALTNLGNCLSGLDRWEESLTLADEASAVYRRLDGTNPPPA